MVPLEGGDCTISVVCLILLSAVHFGLVGHLCFHGNQLFMLALSPTGNLYSQKQVVSFIQSQRGENIFLSCLRMVPRHGSPQPCSRGAMCLGGAVRPAIME